MAKRRSSSSVDNPLSKTRQTGIDPEWNEDFPWMLSVEDGTGMLCSLCRKHSRRPKKSVVGKAVWTDTPCRSITRQALVKHSRSESHTDAVKLEAALGSARTEGGIERAFQRVVSAERKAMIGSLKCMYFLNKREIAHTTNFVPLCELSKSLGALYLQDLQRGGNAHYTSERFKQDLVEALAETVAKPIQECLRKSPFFSICIDETTDVSVTKQLIVYCRYLVNANVHSSFISILELPDGTALTIVEAVCKLCEDLNLDMRNRLCGLGSDGASVMLGARGGVSKLLKDRVPFLAAHHCIAHRLALACGQSADEISYLKRFKSVLDQLYRFYSNSAVRTAGLRAIQEVLDDPHLKLTQAKDVRWLSHERAVSHLRQCFTSVILSLDKEGTENNCAEAAGLCTFIRSYNFIASLYMFSDVLPPLASLSRAFQRKDVNFTVVKPLVNGTLAAINALRATPGEHFQCLSSVIAELEEYGVNPPSDSQVENYKRNVYDKYLKTLADHITYRFPDMDLLEAFSLFDASTIPEELESHGSHSQSELRVLIDRYGPHSVINGEESKSELKVFNSVVAANSQLKQLPPRELMTHILSTTEIQAMFPNLSKLAAIGLLLPMSTVDCERGFSALSRIKTNLRNRLSSRILNDLMTITVEGPPPSEFPYEQACDIWAGWRNRRVDVSV